MHDTLRNARDDAYEGRALVAVFADREAAHAAARALHDEGFRRTWIGVTHVAGGETANEASGATGSTYVKPEEGESIAEKIGRFFSGERGERTLYDELVRHGVAESEARRIDASLEPNSAILTVDGHNHPELAAQIIEQHGGHVVAGEAFATSSGGPYDAADESVEPSRRGSEVLGYGDAAQYARGRSIDEQQRMQLREERLNIDKRSEAIGEAQIRKEVVEHRQDVDVPVVREELFVERRPVGEGVASTGPIAEGETIRIPLMREQILVTKRAVVTGEVVVGKRQVTDTERVSDTTREERVKVSGPEGAIDARGYDEEPRP